MWISSRSVPSVKQSTGFKQCDKYWNKLGSISSWPDNIYNAGTFPYNLHEGLMKSFSFNMYTGCLFYHRPSLELSKCYFEDHFWRVPNVVLISEFDCIFRRPFSSFIYLGNRKFQNSLGLFMYHSTKFQFSYDNFIRQALSPPICHLGMWTIQIIRDQFLLFTSKFIVRFGCS